MCGRADGSGWDGSGGQAAVRRRSVGRGGCVAAPRSTRLTPTKRWGGFGQALGDLDRFWIRADRSGDFVPIWGHEGQTWERLKQLVIGTFSPFTRLRPDAG